jgi:Tetratricopeptide repeat
MGLAYRDQGRFDAALDCFEQCLLAFHQVGDRLGKAKTLNSIGGSLDGQG